MLLPQTCSKVHYKFLILITFCVLSISGKRLANFIKFDINDDPIVNKDNDNTRPILGILTQEVSQLILNKYPDKDFTSYIAASYVKFVEGAGGRVVPIWIGKPREYYDDILSKVNGVLLPGGATYFNNTNGYADAGRHIYEISMEKNDNGTYFPVWGTCLGFELLVYLSANSTEPRTYCSSSTQALPLEFLEGYEKSKLFRNASNEIIEILKTEPVTANFHMYCFTQETFADMKLNNIWNVMSINHDWNGDAFISTIEHKSYPFYGVQFHPEKNLYEFIPNRNITHTKNAIRTSQYFADFLVNEARRNNQKFMNESEEDNYLIYNYAPLYTGKQGSAFVQQYLFETDDIAERNASIVSGYLSVSVISLFISLICGFALEQFLIR